MQSYDMKRTSLKNFFYLLCEQVKTTSEDDPSTSKTVNNKPPRSPVDMPKGKSVTKRCSKNSRANKNVEVSVSISTLRH